MPASGGACGGSFTGNLRRRLSCRGTRRSANGRSLELKRGAGIGRTKRGKGTQLMLVADGRGGALGVRIGRASPAAVTLIQPTVNQVAVPRSGPSRARAELQRVIYEKAADSDALRLPLKTRGIESICPYQSNRKKACTTGWAFATALPPPLGDRKDCGMARKLPQTSRPA